MFTFLKIFILLFNLIFIKELIGFDAKNGCYLKKNCVLNKKIKD